MMLIYTPHITSRVVFISKYLFNSILGVQINFTSDKKEYINYEYPKINYSNEILEGITVKPHSLLFETGIRNISIETEMFKNVPVLFPIRDSSELPFDAFAAAFFMITRYEEYWQQKTDAHNRPLASASIAYRHNFLDIPVVEYWAILLKEQINKTFPRYLFPEREYTFTPTIDVDIAYAYLYRSWIRTIGATTKSLLKADWKDNKRRFKTLFAGQHDPYDTYALFHSWHNQYNLKPIYFFLLGRYGTYDKNISPHRKGLQQLIRNIHKEYKIGIHPSYQSNYNKNFIKEEIEKLEKITGEKIFRSRQHFLMLRFPETYQQLVKNGITEDYTMGYAARPGFRAGTCTPFPFYDLSTETETALKVYPFQVMDGTLNQYQKLSPLEAVETISKIVNEVKKVKGTFISLWHNESLSEIREWHRWKEVYLQLLKLSSISDKL